MVSIPLQIHEWELVHVINERGVPGDPTPEPGNWWTFTYERDNVQITFRAKINKVDEEVSRLLTAP